MKTFINLFTLILLAAAVAPADEISIVFDEPEQTGSPGETLQFFGTITNTDTNPGDAPIYLNGDSLNLALSDAVANDLFLTNVPIDLAEGASSGDIELFDFTLANPESDPFGPYSGAYTLLGGMDGGTGTAQGILAQASFSIDVEPPSSTPEPATLPILGAAFTLMGWVYRKEQKKKRRASKSCGGSD